MRKLVTYLIVIGLAMGISIEAYSQPTGTPISGSSNYTISESGDYYLAEDSNVKILVNPGIVATLDLNGYSISYSGSTGYIVHNTGGTLTIIDSSSEKAGALVGKGTEKGDAANVSGMIFRNDSGCIIMQGGTVKNCRSKKPGPAIFNAEGATFIFEGGVIDNCVFKDDNDNTNYIGGGAINNHGIFKMKGSALINNCRVSSNHTTIAHYSGGGAILSDGQFDMEGGTIQACYVTGDTGFDSPANISKARGGGAVLICGGTFTMTGGQITQCHVTNRFTHGAGGGVLIVGSGVGTMSGGSINNCYLGTESDTMYGGGVAVWGAYYSGSNYGTITQTSASFYMTGGTIEYNNSPGYGGGGLSNNFGYAEVTGGSITHNSTGLLGGGILSGNGAETIFGGTAVVSYNTVTNIPTLSDSDHGGGGMCIGKASGNNKFTMNGGQVYGNKCLGTDGDKGKGGGIYLRNPGTGTGTNDFTMNSGLIYNNEAGTAGGGIYTNGVVTINGGSIYNNEAGTTGGGMNLTGSDCIFVMTNGEVYDNVAGSNGGGAYINGKPNTDVATITGGSVNNNTSAGSGGGIYVKSGNVEFSAATASMIINGNDADVNGGALCVASGNVSVEGGQLLQNTAKNDGGAIYVSAGTVTLSYGTISKNKAGFNNTSGNGGGLYVSGGDVDFSGGEVSENEALNGKGGGIFVNGGNVTFDNGSLIGNKAMNGGGICLGQKAQMTFYGGLITNNQAIAKHSSIANTAYHGGTNIEGCGGGIYLESGTSSTKRTTLTFSLDPLDKTFGLYSNLADMGGDEIVSEGLYTEVVLPSVKDQQLYGFDGKDATPFWYQDYFLEDPGYKNHEDGRAVYPVDHVDRYRSIIDKYTNDYLQHRIPDELLGSIKNNYLCLTLSYNMLDITLTALNMLGHETALFQLIRHGSTEDKKYDVLLKVGKDGKASRTLRNMPWGTYSVIPNDAWNWEYESIAPQHNFRLGETGNYEFKFNMVHINNAILPEHDESQPAEEEED